MPAPLMIIGMISGSHCYVASDAKWDPERTSKFERGQGLQDIKLSFRLVAPDNELLAAEFHKGFAFISDLCSTVNKYGPKNGVSSGISVLDEEEKSIRISHKVFVVSKSSSRHLTTIHIPVSSHRKRLRRNTQKAFIGG